MTADQKELIADFLSQFPDMSLRIGAGSESTSFSLKKMERLAELLGHPEQAFPAIHVAGSNGKGSVVSYCAAALQAAGYKVGQYTSPHFGEGLKGIQIDGTKIDSADALEHIQAIGQALNGVPGLSLFEIETMIAMLHFARKNVDIAVIEVGLGGLHDATNIVRPIATVITAIDLEHQAVLGASLAEIAAHKAGIIKANAPLILAPQVDEVRSVIYREARKKSVDILELGRDFHVERIELDRSGQTLKIKCAEKDEQIRISSLGRFQIENAALAYGALGAITGQGFPMAHNDIKEGFVKTNWPGRFEIIRGEQNVILDAAHTPNAAKSLAQSLKENFGPLRFGAIAGFSDDKQAAEILQILKTHLQFVIATQSQHPRAMDSAALEEVCRTMGIKVFYAPSSQAALAKAAKMNGESNSTLIFGSVFLVEEVRRSLLGNSENGEKRV